jgi:TRAP-type C4-dicarboxylate transport system permease small subunit
MKKALRAYVKIMDKVSWGLGWLLRINLLFSVVVVFSQVVIREFGWNAPFTEELARYSNINMAFLACAYVTRKDAMMKVDTMHLILRGAAKEAVIELSRLVSLVFIILFIVSSVPFCKIGLGQFSPSMHFNIIWVFVLLPIWFTFALLNWAAYTFEKWGKLE